MRHWQKLGSYQAETTTYSEFGTGKYSPVEKARLVGLRAMSNRAAASSLQNHVEIKLTCTTFTPNSIYCGSQGGGLQTAPIAAIAVDDWECNEEVQAGVPITIEGKNISETDTPVTVNVELYGLFDNGK